MLSDLKDEKDYKTRMGNKNKTMKIYEIIYFCKKSECSCEKNYMRI